MFLFLLRRPRLSTLFPYTTLFRSALDQAIGQFERVLRLNAHSYKAYDNLGLCYAAKGDNDKATRYFLTAIKLVDRKSTRLNSSHMSISYAVFCLKKKIPL